MTAGIGIFAVASLIAVIVKKSRSRNVLKPCIIGESELPIDLHGESNLNYGSKGSTADNMIAAKAESAESEADKDQKDQTTAQSVSNEIGQRAVQNVPTNKPVGQYDDDMHLIAEYESASAAAKAVGSNRTSIRDAANGKQKHAAGYVWKYLD